MLTGPFTTKTMSDTDTIDVAVTKTLMPINEETTFNYKVEVERLERLVEYFKNQLYQAENKQTIKERALAELVSDAKDATLPEDANIDGMWARLTALVKKDTDDIWNFVREYQVDVEFKVIVRGYVMANNEEEAQRLVEEDLPVLKLYSDGVLTNVDLHDVTYEDMDLMEY